VFARCSETDWHIVEIDVRGLPSKETGHAFNVHTVRRNPSARGHVTGSATLQSFLSSILRKFRLTLCSFFYCHQTHAHTFQWSSNQCTVPFIGMDFCFYYYKQNVFITICV